MNIFIYLFIKILLSTYFNGFYFILVIKFSFLGILTKLRDSV